MTKFAPAIGCLSLAAVKTNTCNPSAAPEVLAPNPADNYHRWWNNAWRVVEPEGQQNAVAWTAEKESRLNQLVAYATQTESLDSFLHARRRQQS